MSDAALAEYRLITQALAYAGAPRTHNENGPPVALPFEDSTFSWERLIELAAYHGMVPWVYYFLKEQRRIIPDKYRASLDDMVRRINLNNIVFSGTFYSLLKLFESARIPLVPLKGMRFLLDLYRERPSRPMCDIDFLVPAASVDAADALLLKNGYAPYVAHGTKTYWRTHQMHFTYYAPQSQTTGPLSLEMHWALDYPRSYRQLPEIWDRLSVLTSDRHRVPVLSMEDELFCLALHQRRFGPVLTLKYVLDVVRIFSHTRLDTDYILTAARTSRVQKALYYLLVQARQWVNNDDCSHLITRLPQAPAGTFFINAFVRHHQYSLRYDNKELFPRIYCQLFDSLPEACASVWSIPYHQFCRYFSLEERSPAGRISYMFRGAFFFVYAFRYCIKRIARFLSIGTKHEYASNRSPGR